jgi:hypothetical protein
VHDGRIERIGPDASIQVPMRALRIDGTGKYLIPGLADMHVHISTTQELPLYVANGVTVLRNMNGRPVHLDWRTRLLAGQLLGPRLRQVPSFIRLSQRMKAKDWFGIKRNWATTESKSMTASRQMFTKAILSTAKELHKPVWGQNP